MKLISSSFFFLIGVLPLFLCKSEKPEWPEVTQTSKPWTRWWWMDDAVDKENLSRELNELAKAGIGGVEITSIYGVKGEEARTIDYLSPEFSSMINFVCDKADTLGMGVDLPPGSGWRCGGPFVPEEKGLWNLQFDVSKNDKSGNKDYSARAVKNGGKVKRPAKGGEGWAIDTFDKEITQWYLNEFWKKLGVDENKLRCFFHDSFEYTGDFTTDFMNEFRQRRGYDLNDFLYVLAGDCEDKQLTARIFSDYRETLADLVLQSFIIPMTEWAHQHGSLNRNQAHGSPGNLLDLYAACDIPETEFFGRIPEGEPEIFVQKFASSAAHVTGQKLVSSESFTWLDEHWTVTPKEMRSATNRLFLAGVNHMFFHGNCYSPADAEWPGWVFYASTQMNNRNPLWREMPALFKYIQRTQSVLQTSHPENDVLVYWPYYDVIGQEGKIFKHIGVAPANGWFYNSTLAGLSRKLMDEGVSFDFISDRQLLQSKPEGTRITTGGGSRYKAIIVPETTYIPLKTMQKLSAFLADGGQVIFDNKLPQTVPGYFDWKEREAQLKELNQKVPHEQVGDALQILRDKKISGEKELAAKGFYFRKLIFNNECVYLVFNLSKETKDAWIPLSASGYDYIFMDPMNGEFSRAASGRDGVRIQLQPEQAVFIRCTNKRIQAEPFQYLEKDWKKEPVNGRWKVSFVEGGPVFPENIEMTGLKSWTRTGDAETERFAGTAGYSLEFEWTGPSLAYLDLGNVLDCARVRLNNKSFGTLLGPQFGLFVDNLQNGKNKLVVEVTNVAANRIRDLDKRGVEWKKFKDINFVNIDYQPFDASDWKIREAGLLGPVTLSYKAMAE